MHHIGFLSMLTLYLTLCALPLMAGEGSVPGLRLSSSLGSLATVSLPVSRQIQDAATGRGRWAPSPVSGGGRFGIGIILGAPTGLSLKYWLDRRHAIDAAVAWDLSDSDFHVHASYLHHWLDHLPWSPYIGLGGRFRRRASKNDSDTTLGPRVPGGISHFFVSAPVEIFAEAAFIFDLTPRSKADVDLGIGLRVYF